MTSIGIINYKKNSTTTGCICKFCVDDIQSMQTLMISHQGNIIKTI